MSRRPTIFLLLLFHLAAGRSLADGKTTQAVNWLKSIKRGYTLAQVKKTLLAGVSLAKPQWMASEFALGTYVLPSGKLEGIFVFLSDPQRKLINTHHGSEMTDAQKKFNPSDTIETAMLTVAHTTGKKSTGKIVKALTTLLGKPQVRKYAPVDGPDAGWYVEWKLSGGRLLTLTEDSEVHLIETFGMAHRP